MVHLEGNHLSSVLFQFLCSWLSRSDLILNDLDLSNIVHNLLEGHF